MTTKKNNEKAYISILRGINVGGNKKIKMDALREMYSELGYTHVQSYIQSGNVIFSTEKNDTESLQKTISAKIKESFGFDVPVLVYTAKEMKTNLENNPFKDDSSKDVAFIHLTFLSTIPEKSLVEKITTSSFAPDEFILTGKVLYLYCPNGYGQTKLTNTFFENKLKLTATTRNLKTATELLNVAEKN